MHEGSVDSHPIQVPSAAEAPPRAVIAETVPCLHCGYDLRGLQPERRCPECGNPCAVSLRGNRLCDFPPAWVERLAVGARGGLTGVAVIWTAGLVEIIVTAPAFTSNIATWLAVAFLVLSLTLGSVLVWIGLWRITTPLPHSLEPESKLSARRLTRAMLITAPPAWVAGVALVVHTRIPSPVILFALVPGVVSCVLLGIAYPRFAEGLLRRAQSPNGTGTARFLQFIVLAWVVVAVAEAIIGWSANPSNGDINIAGCGGLIAMVAYAIGMMVFQSELAVVLRDAAATAKLGHQQIEALTPPIGRAVPREAAK